LKLDDYFKDAKAYVWKEKYAICKSKKTIPDAFVNIIDNKEITVIIDQEKLNSDIIENEKDWRILTLDIIFPMNVAGVTAKVATALAKEGITIMPIAAYSRDHFLIKDKDIEKAIKVLEKLGITIT